MRLSYSTALRRINTDPNLEQAFEQLSSSKQDEFLEYIETAKLKETKLSQIEKIKPMIKESIGLNDKYRYN